MKKIVSDKNIFLFSYKLWIGFFIINIIFISCTLAQKTKQIHIEKANSLEYDVNLGKDVQRLIGDVVLRHDSILLYCDSAYFYSSSNNVDAYGNVHIKQNDTLNLFGDKLYYKGDQKTADIHGNVELVDNKIILTTDALFYDLTTKVASYNTGGKIVDDQNQLTSIIGKYYSAVKEFFFKDSVVVVNPRYTMKSDTLKYNTASGVAYFYGPTRIYGEENFIYTESGWSDTKNNVSELNKNPWYRKKTNFLKGDSLFYNRNTGIGKAIRNVTMADTAQKILINGDFAYRDERNNWAFVTENAVLIQVNKSDSLFMHADSLIAIGDTATSVKALFAYNKVRYYKSDLQGVCDSLVYLIADSVLTMYKDPVIWSDSNQLIADTIIIIITKNEIKQLYLQNAAFITSIDDSARYNQVKGKNMVGYFEKNDLKRLDVFSNGQSVYYLRDDKQALIGINKSESDDIVIYFQENNISRIKLLTNPKAILYPDGELEEKELLLKDFRWEEEKRPQHKNDIF